MLNQEIIVKYIPQLALETPVPDLNPRRILIPTGYTVSWNNPIFVSNWEVWEIPEEDAECPYVNLYLMNSTHTARITLYDFLRSIQTFWNTLDVYQFIRALDPVVDGQFMPVGYPLIFSGLTPQLVDAGFALDLDRDDAKYLHLYWSPWPEMRATHAIMAQQWYYVGRLRRTNHGFSLRQNYACPLQCIIIRQFLAMCDPEFKAGLFSAVQRDSCAKM